MQLYAWGFFVSSVYSFMVLCRPSQMLSVVYSEPLYSKLHYYSVGLKLMRLAEIIKLWLCFSFMGFGLELTYTVATEWWHSLVKKQEEAKSS